MYFLEDTTFYLLFDFNAEIGDTITYHEPIHRGVFSHEYFNVSAERPAMYQIVVTDIELLNLSNLELRTFETEIVFPEELMLMPPSSIIENMGSTSQKFTGDKYFYVGDGCFGGLQCYNNGDVEYKPNETYETPNPSCDIIDSVHESNFESRIDVYSNPTDDQIHIASEDKIERIEIFSIDVNI